MIAFVITIVLLLSLLIIFVAFTVLHNGINAISDATTKISRQLVVCKDKKTADTLAAKSASMMLSSYRNIDKSTIKTKVDYATGSKQWEKGQFFTLTVSAKINTGSPFVSRVYSKKVLMMIERNVPQDESLFASNVSNATVPTGTTGDNSQWLDIVKNMAYAMSSNGFHYKRSGNKKTYQSALRSNKGSNCATAVAWCLQEVGALRSGQVFYCDKSGYHGPTNIKAKIIRNPRLTDLQPGDIVGFGIPYHGGNVAHTAVFYKKEGGKYLWISFGNDGCSGGKHNYNKMVGRVHKQYTNKAKMSCIIRLEGVGQTSD